MANTKVLTKKQLIETISLSNDIVDGTKAGTERILNLIADTIMEATAKGNTVAWSGFINLKPSVQKAKTGTVPGSNPPKQYNSPAKNIVKITPTADFKRRVEQDA